MKVLLVHNYYKQRGGEDESFEAELNMLKEFGHDVQSYTRHNDDIDGMSKSRVAMKTIWNRTSYHAIKSRLKHFDADVVHCTNLFPLISTSVYNAARECDVPVIQSLRNYRLTCLNANYFRDGQVCEKCSKKRFAWPGVIHGCYRKSNLGSAVVAAHNTYHKISDTWKKNVDAFFSPTEFTRAKYVEAGFSEQNIFVKPNFLCPDPGVSQEDRNGALFVGRLSPEKGLKTLVETWVSLGTQTTLRIVGSGVMDKYIGRIASKHQNIVFDGQLPLNEVQQLLGQAKFLIMPSEWYETFGRTIMEAYSRGTPVIASRLGAMAEIVEDEKTGICYSPGETQQLAAAINRLLDDEKFRAFLGSNARVAYEQKYTAQENHEQLIKIYQFGIDAAIKRRRESELSGNGFKS